RNMQYPWLRAPYPAHSGSVGDIPWNNNNVAGGDHYALAGVQNRWFYLLVNGGTGSWNNISFSVEGIGLEQAIQVVYDNMVNRLGPNSSYLDAVYGSIAAAQALYPGTNVELEVKRAWHAVGLYPDPEVPCATVTFTNSTGSFEDGSSGLAYANGLDCSWLIAPGGAESITLDFSTFGVAANDAVYVYGGSTADAPLLAVYSGSILPAGITHIGPALFIRFVTDATGGGAGWNATYSSDVLSYCSSAEYPFNAASGTFEDGSSTNAYRPNTQCGWYIAPPGATSVTLSFAQFQTEATHDVVKVYSTLDTSLPPIAVLSGSSIPSPVTSTTGQMFIAFQTNSTTHLAGWSASYTSTGSGYCGGTSLLSATSGSFTDGSGANNYYNNTSCSWLIQPTGASAVQLNFTSFNLEAASSGIVNDKLVVRDGNSASAPILGTYHGSNVPGPIISSGP
ncbi:MAG: M4 family metallopeptidase, partial [Flavobacteriales bacterium]|nr:M4 family metallopeptidase [Flavobacteriales bacterium]